MNGQISAAHPAFVLDAGAIGLPDRTQSKGSILLSSVYTFGEGSSGGVLGSISTLMLRPITFALISSDDNLSLSFSTMLTKMTITLMRAMESVM